MEEVFNQHQSASVYHNYRFLYGYCLGRLRCCRTKFHSRIRFLSIPLSDQGANFSYSKNQRRCLSAKLWKEKKWLRYIFIFWQLFLLHIWLCDQVQVWETAMTLIQTKSNNIDIGMKPIESQLGVMDHKHSQMSSLFITYALILLICGLIINS